VQTIQKIAETLYTPLTTTFGIEWSTALLIEGLVAGGIIVYLARLNGKDSFEIKDGITVSGLVSLSFLGMIDYLHLINGMTASTYWGKKIIEVANLTMFFAVLTVAWILWKYQWPGKYEVYEKITG